MMQSVREIFQAAYADSLEIIPEGPFEFVQKNNDGKEKQHVIEPNKFKKALKNKFGDFDKFSDVFSRHLLGQKNIIAA